MTILDDFKSLKVLPHKKNRDVVVDSCKNSCKLITTSSSFNFNSNSINRSLLRSPQQPSTKTITFTNMRSASMSPRTFRALGAQEEFVLQHPVTAFGGDAGHPGMPLGIQRNAGHSVSTTTTSSNNISVGSETEAVPVPATRTTTRPTSVLQPRSWSHGNLFSLSSDDATDYIPFLRSRHFRGENIPLPGMATSPRPRGTRVGIAPPETPSKIPDRVGKAGVLLREMGIAGGAKGGTDMAPTTPETTYRAATATVTGSASKPSPAPVDAATFRTPVGPRRPDTLMQHQLRRYTPHGDGARYSLPRTLSLRPRAKSFRNRVSMTRELTRHRSESLSILASNNNRGYATTSNTTEPSPEENHHEQDYPVDDNGRSFFASGPTNEEDTTPPTPPMIPRW